MFKRQAIKVNSMLTILSYFTYEGTYVIMHDVKAIYTSTKK